MIRRLEAYGAEAWQSEVSEWVWYSNADQEATLRHAGEGLSLTMWSAKVRAHVQRADETVLRAPFAENFLGNGEPHDVRHILRAGAPYLPQQGAGGEMVLSAGKVDCFYHNGVDGILDVSPFTCMNGIVSEALYPRQSVEHAGLPVKNVYVHGTDRDLSSDLEIFRELARAYQRVKPHPRRYPACFN